MFDVYISQTIRACTRDTWGSKDVAAPQSSANHPQESLVARVSESWGDGVAGHAARALELEENGRHAVREVQGLQSGTPEYRASWNRALAARDQSRAQSNRAAARWRVFIDRLSHRTELVLY